MRVTGLDECVFQICPKSGPRIGGLAAGRRQAVLDASSGEITVRVCSFWIDVSLSYVRQWTPRGPQSLATTCCDRGVVVEGGSEVDS